jgi:hypothetical protein
MTGVVRCFCRMAALSLIAITAASLSTAQTSSSERTFAVSKVDVEKALHSIPQYPGGKLPVLDGFAEPSGQSLDGYKRGYYEYSVQLKPAGANQTIVHVTARITAWNNAAASSGYRVLKSSGRLESDLLDALDEKLNPQSAGKQAGGVKVAVAPRLPDSPSASAAALFNTPRLTTAPSGSLPSTPLDPATAKKVQALTKEKESLEEILHNQVRPANLGVVKRSNTPVVAQPVDGAEVLFQADSEDEFEILDSTDTWVHIKISDLSRGWIRRDYVDVPGAAKVNIVASASDTHDADSVRETKEQVAPFPGKWEPLDGKQVKIIWVQPRAQDQFGSGPRWGAAKSVFRSADAGPASAEQVAGVVVIFDSQDGGMTATTMANLQQWRAGHLSDDAFWRRCWRDPPDAFQLQR